MRLVISIAFSCWLLTLFLPWWTIALPCLILGAWLGENGRSSFLYGLFGVGLLWLVQSFYIHITGGSLLTSRMADLFSLPHPSLVIAVTVVIGGLCGGLSTLTGFFFREAFLSGNTSAQPADS